MGLRYAASAPQTHHFSPKSEVVNGSASAPAPALTGVSCLGNEETLHDCAHDEDNFCPGSGPFEVAAVVCADVQADLEPDIWELMASTHLEDKQLFYLSVSMYLLSDLHHRPRLRSDLRSILLA